MEKGARIMDSKTGLDSKILLWLAGELGLSVVKLSSGYFLSAQTRPLPNAPEMFVFDLEADTPDGAWLRDKAEKYLAKRYGVFIRPMFDEDVDTGEIGFMYWGIDGCGANIPAPWLQQAWQKKEDALLFEIEWLYNKEHDHD